MVFRIGKVVNAKLRCHLDQCTLVSDDKSCPSRALLLQKLTAAMLMVSGDHQCGKRAERHGRMLPPCETGGCRG